jgi:hypothetical protein
MGQGSPAGILPAGLSLVCRNRGVKAMPGVALKGVGEAEGARFGSRERRALRRVLPQAHDLAGAYYRIPPWAWRRTPYDVLTAGDPQARLASSEGILAVLDRCAYTHRDSQSVREQTIYRVSLQDPCFLRATERDSRLELRALLLYVLTHELVHVVRFHTAMKDFDAVGDREAEETRVHGVTFQILKGLQNRNIRFVLERYEAERRPFMAS